MRIAELGYALIGAPDVAAWRDFATATVGAMAIDGPDGALYVKIDPRAFRIAVLPGRDDGLVASGWLVATAADFAEAKLELERDGVTVEPGDGAGRGLRRVQDYFAFTDPAGHRHEIAWGPISDFTPFVSPAGVSGFVTEGIGLGHVVLAATDTFDVEVAFWQRPDRFGLSDILRVPTPGGAARVHFMHCNPRQHSLAIGELPIPGGCIHMMLEVATMDDVGRALDRAAANGVTLTATLGRHVNDEMFSFYMLTPAGFSLEYGCNGRIVDWTEHVVFETTRGSHWGHDFSIAMPKP